nr:ribonuclease H-like domain-containing protein [Tanacetum cinerariifolium]
MYPRFLTICLRMSQFGRITHTHQYVVPFHTKKLFTTLLVNSPSFSGRIVPFFDTMLVHQGDGPGTPTEPHHTPTLEVDTSHPTTSSIPIPSLSTAPIPLVTQTDTTPIRQYSRRARIAQSYALPTVADEHVSPVRDVSEGEACPTESGFIADQDRATIAKSSTLPHDSAPRAQEEEILRLKERVQVLEDRDSVAAKHSGDDAPIKGRSINEGEAFAERISNDLEEIARVLTSMDAATVLAGGIDVPSGSGSIPTAGPPAADISTGSEVAPTASPIVTAGPIVTSYSRRKGKEGKEVMMESDTPKKQKVQEQIDAQVARELEEQQEKEDMRMNEQIARDAEVARYMQKKSFRIDEDDMEEMDIKWSMALLSMRADKFWKRTRKKISIQGSDVAGFENSKVECFNCHKMGHFARELEEQQEKENMRMNEQIARNAEEVEINRLKDRVQNLEYQAGVIGDKSGDDAPIKWRSTNEGEAPAERISNDSKEIARVLTSIDAATVLAGETNVPTGSGSIPTPGPPATIVSTGSEVGPTASPIVRRRKGKEIMIARDAEVARIHAEEEIQDLSLKKKIELISDLVKYQDHYKRVYKFQSQQRKPMSKKQKREYYMAVIKSYLGWRFKDFKEKEKVKKQKLAEEAPEPKTPTEEVEDFIPIGSKEETERLKWKDLLRQLDKEDLNQLWALVKEYLSIRPASSDKC